MPKRVLSLISSIKNRNLLISCYHDKGTSLMTFRQNKHSKDDPNYYAKDSQEIIGDNEDNQNSLVKNWVLEQVNYILTTADSEAYDKITYIGDVNLGVYTNEPGKYAPFLLDDSLVTLCSPKPLKRELVSANKSNIVPLEEIVARDPNVVSTSPIILREKVAEKGKELYSVSFPKEAPVQTEAQEVRPEQIKPAESTQTAEHQEIPKHISHVGNSNFKSILGILQVPKSEKIDIFNNLSVLLRSPILANKDKSAPSVINKIADIVENISKNELVDDKKIEEINAKVLAAINDVKSLIESAPKDEECNMYAQLVIDAFHNTGNTTFKKVLEELVSVKELREAIQMDTPEIEHGPNFT